MTQAEQQELFRGAFVNAIKNHAEQVWNELLSLHELYLATPEPEDYTGWHEFDFLLERSGHTPEGVFAKELDAWAKKYHLTEPWLMDWAIRVLQTLSADPSLNLPRLALIQELFEVPHGVEPPRLPAFNPMDETQAQYTRKVHKLLEVYINAVEKYYKSEGVIEKSKASELERHSSWTVRHQCLGSGWAKIAKEDRLKSKRPGNTVSDAVNTFAGRIDLHLRPKV